ncbi:unnamed protein product [Heligmosomoides polygyrus]|uniref:Neuropeptide-Like Protein n=1 Tax=Heligmosomoides polygyrus TaxID=6339 RepID=A0A183G6I4_HELPZ|nr:unnamed protein product [Heligmosomoides polygyrus]
MVQMSTYARVFLTCFCYVILSSYVIALPDQYRSRPSLDNNLLSWRLSELPQSRILTSSALEKRAMMRLGKRVESGYGKRAIMRLGK